MAAKRKVRTHAWVLLRDGAVRSIFMFKDEAIHEKRRLIHWDKFKWAVKRVTITVED